MKKILVLISFMFCFLCILTGCSFKELNNLKIEIELENKKQEILLNSLEQNRINIEEFNYYFEQCLKDFQNIDNYYEKLKSFIVYDRNLKESLEYIDENRSLIAYERELEYLENLMIQESFSDEEENSIYNGSNFSLDSIKSQISFSDFIGYKNTDISIYSMINLDTGYTEELIIIKDVYSQYLLTLIWDKGKVIEFYYE